MNISDLSQVTQYFYMYGKDEKLGRKFFHIENDNFKIIITPENELYQLNTDHEPWGIELDTIENLKIRFKSFTGENLEDGSGERQPMQDEILSALNKLNKKPEPLKVLNKTKNFKVENSDFTTCSCGSKYGTMRWFNGKIHHKCDVCWWELIYDEQR